MVDFGQKVLILQVLNNQQVLEQLIQLPHYTMLLKEKKRENQYLTVREDIQKSIKVPFSWLIYTIFMAFRISTIAHSRVILVVQPDVFEKILMVKILLLIFGKTPSMLLNKTQ